MVAGHNSGLLVITTYHTLSEEDRQMNIKKLKTAASLAYHRFIKLKGEPRQIALGFSLGIVIGMTPFFGMHIVFCLILASLFGWSKIAAMVGVQITNVVTIPLIYPLNYWVGVKLLGGRQRFKWPSEFDFYVFMELMKDSPAVLVNLVVGGLVLGIPLAVGGYFFALRSVNLYREKRTVKRQHSDKPT